MVRTPALTYALLTLGAAAMLIPFLDMFVGALRAPADLLQRRYWPAEPQWGNFARVFADLPIWRWFLNSVLVATLITAAQLLTSSMAGYALAKHRFRGRRTLLMLVLGGQMFPFFLFIIPWFFLLRFWPMAGGNDWLGRGGGGLLGSYAALILPFLITWYGVFLMRQFCLRIPDELLDAARADGAGEWRVFTLVVLPLIRPALVTLGVFAFIYHWNEFIWTMTVTRSAPELQTLPVGIYLMEGAYPDLADQALQQAALAVSVTPVALAFLALQALYGSRLGDGAGVKG